MYNHCSCGKVINIKYSEYVSVALVIQHAKRMHYTTLPTVAPLGIQFFSTLSYNWHNFWKKVFGHRTCTLIFSTISVPNTSHCKKNSATNICMFHVKYPLFLSDFNQTWILLTEFLKILKYPISWRSVQWKKGCSMWMGGHRQMTWIDSSGKLLNLKCSHTTSTEKMVWP